MEKSKMFSINGKDVLVGLVVAIIAGAILPVLAILQSPGFDIGQANWSAIWTLALNGAIASMASYIATKFFSDSNGTPLGSADRLK
jgi:uncharacterized PurR-regulated membrane protein YhhQ (DUF165 family)